MKRNSVLTFLKEKSFIIVLTLMLVSAGTMAALFAFGGNDVAEESEIAKQEQVQEKATENESLQPEKASAEETAEADSDSGISSHKKTTDTKEDKTAAVNQENAAMTAELEDQYLEAEEMAEVSGVDVIAEGFAESDVYSLQWPVEGEILLPFSMDQSIYLKTLAQYQYHPAMLISAEKGSAVTAAAAGTVIDVGESNAYGHYVTVDLGDGFTLTYGQLTDITTEVGEMLEAGEQFAAVNFAVGNYQEEGDNLYLQLIQDEVPVDPEMYLE